MKLPTLLIITIFIVGSCNTTNYPEKTKRIGTTALKKESEIKLPIKNNFTIYSYLNVGIAEFLYYKSDNYIYLLNLSNEKIEDSIKVVLDSFQTEKYGDISSFCFNGKDSLFLLLNRAIIFLENKKLNKIIPINELDTIQFNQMRFANIEDSPIFFEKGSNSIIGQVYCSKCKQTDSTFYTQKIIGKISLTKNKLELYNFKFPSKYINNYYGFANKVYTNTYDSITLVSFPCDESVYILNRTSDKYTHFSGRSKYQTVDAESLPVIMSSSREEKMRHMATVPYYSEIKYDVNKKLYYRFFLRDIPLKNKEGKYNSFNDKGLILIVFNSDHEVIGEYELGKYYNNYISFVGKSGLYINFFSPDPSKSDGKVFKILTFK